MIDWLIDRLIDWLIDWWSVSCVSFVVRSRLYVFPRSSPGREGYPRRQARFVFFHEFSKEKNVTMRKEIHTVELVRRDQIRFFL